MSSLQGRVYSVTGAASGIGRAVAIRLGELGAAGIALSDVNAAGLEETKKQVSSSTKVKCTTLDVRQQAQVEAWIKDTLAEFGRLDGAANVAGIAGGDSSTTCASIKEEDWDMMMDVNLKAVMWCMRAQLPALTRPTGAIVNVSSTSGLRGFPGNAAYASSKFGVIGLSESAAGEFGGEGIRVNAILPGPIATEMFQAGEAKGIFDSKSVSAATCLGRMGKAHEVARVLCFMLSDDASFVTGAHWTVDGGYAAC